jgi:dihydrofolate reductase
MILSIIVAASSNNVIGKDNKLPWHLPEDLKYFKNTTWAMPVVMGRKTYESIGKPLPGRTNIIITRNKELKIKGVEIVQSLNEAMVVAGKEEVKEIFIIGGAEIFNSTFPLVSRIYITRIHSEMEGDVFFPNFNKDNWVQVKNKDCEPDEKNPFSYSFQVWEKKRVIS